MHKPFKKKKIIENILTNTLRIMELPFAESW